MNILLNNYCNLTCEYCFANHVLEKDRINMSLQSFHKVIEFAKRSNLETINLIGGEPTLHPNFNEIIDKIDQQNFINSIMLFTNGVFKRKQHDRLLEYSKTSNLKMLINYNDFRGTKVMDIMNNNIKELRDHAEITLGINFYKKDQDFDYIIKASKENGLKYIRWSLVVPNTELKAEIDVRNYYLDNKDMILRFLKACLENELIPHVDCNNIPLCLLNDEELRVFAFSSELNLKTSVCETVIDILPNLKVIRCFAFSEYEVDLEDFKDVEELSDHFTRAVDDKFNGVTLFEDCKDCKSFHYRSKSCACLKFKEPITKIV
ncbi:MAG: radical SAM protein [Bacteroidales bacterium]|nr:radical SAM protein [Bacteroidales bacterium]